MKLPCDIVQDLLPLYEDSLCSRATHEAVEEHLKECRNCGKQHTAVQEFHEPEVVAKPEQEKKATAKSFKKIRNRWIASIIVILLLIPAGYLGWGQYQETGPCFTNLNDLYIADRFMNALTDGDYKRAFGYLNIEGQCESWAKDTFIPEIMENMEEDAWAIFSDFSTQVEEQTGGMKEYKFLSITPITEGQYRVYYNVVVDGETHRMEVDVSNGGIEAFHSGRSYLDDPWGKLEAWHYYLWEQYLEVSENWSWEEYYANN